MLIFIRGACNISKYVFSICSKRELDLVVAGEEEAKTIVRASFELLLKEFMDFHPPLSPDASNANRLELVRKLCIFNRLDSTRAPVPIPTTIPNENMEGGGQNMFFVFSALLLMQTRWNLWKRKRSWMLTSESATRKKKKWYEN